MSKSGERLHLAVELCKTYLVNEHYGRNYSSPNNGFKFHARGGRIFVLRVQDCNEEC